MNKLITTLFIFSICYGISAQTEQGQFLMLGETSFRSTTTQPAIYYTLNGDTPDGFESPEYTTNEAEAKLGVGYFLTKNIAFGITGAYKVEPYIKWNDSEIEDEDAISQTQYGVFTRYYIGGIAFIGANYSMVTTNAYDLYDVPSEDRPTTSVLGAEAVFSLFLSKNVALVPSVSYNIINVKEKYGDDVFQAGSGTLQMALGINIHL